MKQNYSFQKDFFQYKMPLPHVSQYDEQYVRSNDLRLVIQIMTKSHLRMHTDPKTSSIHFTCKKRGALCYDLQAFPSEQDQTKYYFDDSLLTKRHCASDCHKINQHFRYLQIYNLFKLKKNLIQIFMQEKNLMKQSPSNILNHLSEKQQNYFFEKYINNNLEYKRKLRKRFDNIINIDIKKIMKHQSLQQNQEIVQDKNVSQKPKKLSTNNAKIDKKVKQIKEKIQKKKAKMLKKEKVYQEDKQSSQSISQNEEEYQVCHRVTRKKKNIEKDQKRPKKIQKISNQRKSKIFADVSNHVMQKDNIRQDQPQLPFDSSLEIPQIRLLNQEPQFYEFDSFSQSEKQNKDEQQHEQNLSRTGLFGGFQDYLKSLKNSALKRSLQKQSLRPLLFAYDRQFQKENINEEK